MIYLKLYLAAGVIALVIIYSSHLLSKERTLRQKADELLKAVDSRRKNVSYRILNTIAPIMAAILVVLAWPVAIYMKISDISKARALDIEEKLMQEKKIFKVQKSDLIEQLSIKKIEELETVSDPLNSVPNIPFGHLNAGWINFVEMLSKDNAIWSFSSKWTSEWNVSKTITGYVILTETNLGPHFITSIESADD